MRLDELRRAGEAEHAEGVVELAAERPDDLGQPAIGEPLAEREQALAQMAVDQAEREGEVGIAFGGDERHRVLVPANRHLVFKGKLPDRHRGQPVGQGRAHEELPLRPLPRPISTCP